MHENSDFLRLVVNSIKKDLDDNNEINNCLALHAIANVGSQEMAEALAEDVHRLLISPYVVASNLSSFPKLIKREELPRAWSRKRRLLLYFAYIASIRMLSLQLNGLYA